MCVPNYTNLIQRIKMKNKIEKKILARQYFSGYKEYVFIIKLPTEKDIQKHEDKFGYNMDYEDYTDELVCKAFKKMKKKLKVTKEVKDNDDTMEWEEIN